MPLLVKIDELRAEARRVSDASRDPNLSNSDWLDYRATLEGLEAKIEELLIVYWSYPICPYPPCTGRLEPTPTKYVLCCSVCKAVTLPGRMSVKIYDPGAA